MLYHVILDVDNLFFVFVVSENHHKWLLRSPLHPLPTISKFWLIQENSTDDGSEQIEESFVEKIKVVIFTDSCLFYNLDICICEEYCLKLIWTFFSCKPSLQIYLYFTFLFLLGQSHPLSHQAAFSEGLKAAAEMSLDVASLSSPFPYPTTIVPSPYPGLKPADQSDQIK